MQWNILAILFESIHALFSWGVYLWFEIDKEFEKSKQLSINSFYTSTVCMRGIIIYNYLYIIINTHFKKEWPKSQSKRIDPNLRSIGIKQFFYLHK